MKPTAKLLLALAASLPGCPAPSASPAEAGTDAAPAMDAAPFDGPVYDASSDGASLPPLPQVPVGLDALRRWDLLPRVRLGVRARMFSTFDRAGNNEAADASHFLRLETPTRAVTMDVEGPGVLYFVRTNHWHGSPWHYGVDGADVLVTETSTADPLHPVAGSVFEPSAALPSLLTWTWSTTRGADLMGVPIPFRRSMTLAYERTHYGMGYYILHRFAEGADHLSQPLRAWDGRTPPDAEVVALLGRAGEDLSPSDATRADSTFALTAGQSGPVANLQGSGVVRALRFSAPAADALALGRARLRVTWDDRAAPSVDAPLGLLAGAGSLYNRDAREWLVRGLLNSIRFSGGRVEVALYFPMPYFRSARVELVASSLPLASVSATVRTVPLTEPERSTAYFHATYVDHGAPQRGRDLVLLDTTSTEGGGEWCGHFVGTAFNFSDRAYLGTLEGDPRFFFDDSQSPQAQGTGTEEWAGGGDYWGGQTMTLPLYGHPVGAPAPDQVRDPEDAIESAYRVLLADHFPFGRNARIQLEHGQVNDSVERYQTVSYWYGRPGACLFRTDALAVGDVVQEQSHAYASPSATAPVMLSSRFELGPDTLDGVSLFPEQSFSERHHTATSEFTAQLRADNVGVLLRRRFDQQWADQRALVYVAPAEGGDFVYAGTWYSAGSNRCVFSNPDGELGAPARTVETSNRRWREDEFLLPRALTAGRERVRLRFEFAPAPHALLPGGTPEPSAWSESQYTVYSYVAP